MSATVGSGTADAATTNYQYDAVGNLIQWTDARGKVITYTYDTNNRKKTVTDPLGRTTSWTYDAANNLLTVTRPDAGVITNVYDSKNQLTSTTDAKGQTTAYAYDAAGNLTTLTDAKSQATSFAYDNKNRMTKKTYADGSFEQWAYNDTANTITPVLVDTKPAGQIVSNYADVRNRITKLSYSDSTPTVTISYDDAGRTLTVSNAAASDTYSYDDANQLLSESENVAGSAGAQTVAYTYDADGNKATVTYPDATVVTYGYTNRNQVATIASTLKTGQQASYTYDLDGNVSTRSLDNGTATTYTYDDDSEVTRLVQSGPAGNFETLVYGYNNVGNRISKATVNTANPSGSYEVYGYDAVDQLTDAKYGASDAAGTGATRDVAYSLDAVGNRTSVDDAGISTSYTANNLNQYTAVGTTTPSYDGNGNLASGPGTFAYDAKNRLISATVGGTTTTLTYDAKNRCVSRSNGTTTTYLVYDGWNLIEEYVGSSTTASEVYVHGAAPDEMVAKKSSSGSLVYYCADALGSVTYLTDISGLVVEHYTYDVYGAVSILDQLGNALTSSFYTNRFMFAGREFLHDLNLYDFRNRFYSATIGRWMSRDPISEMGGLNIYSYCGNNPVSLSDILGLCPNLISMADQALFGDPNNPGSIPSTPSVPTFDASLTLNGNYGAQTNPPSPDLSFNGNLGFNASSANNADPVAGKTTNDINSQLTVTSGNFSLTAGASATNIGNGNATVGANGQFSYTSNGATYTLGGSASSIGSGDTHFNINTNVSFNLNDSTVMNFSFTAQNYSFGGSTGGTGLHPVSPSQFDFPSGGTSNPTQIQR